MNDLDLQSIVEHLRDELATIRTNRATPMLVEKIMVEAYQSQLPINQVATIQTVDATSLLIRPFDKGTIKAIEEAIRASDLGLNPTNEGEQLRLSVPPLTAERRNELIKVVGQKAEAARVRARQIRDERMKDIRAREKSGDLSEDQRFSEEKNIQKMIDETVNEIDATAQEKEKALTTV